MYDPLSNQLWIQHLNSRKATNMDNSQHRNLMGHSDWKKIKHFKKEEFQCGCGCGIRMNREFVLLLDSLRARLGFPVVITSGYRCSRHNKAIKGSPRSQHLKGKAVDIRIKDSGHRYKVLKEVFEMNFAGIGIGDGFLHIDDRDTNLVAWTYK